ncbi:MAG: hypothetical protein C0410_01395 [Anaerolinea sp.]|nr:hypothetical protein [Anaerolinea sp.]
MGVTINSTLEDPIGDVIYLSTNKGEVYSNTLFKKEWNDEKTTPDTDFDLSACATEWDDHPLLLKKWLIAPG